MTEQTLTLEKISPLTEPEQGHGSEIARLETELGITNEEDRLIEASLFIDKHFFDTAIITDTPHPELLFGKREWEGYLKARLATREYGASPLNKDFIIDVYSSLSDDKDHNPKFRNGPMYGGSFDKIGLPITLNPDQLRAVDEDPNLTFEKKGSQENVGYIVYPSSESEHETEQIVERKINDLCEWYNRLKESDNHDPVMLAALLQKRLISIHPFDDFNGRLSRILMNWSLENDGLTPSFISNPNDDIFSDEPTWIGTVRKGCDSYQDLQTRKKQALEDGMLNIPELFGLSHEHAFYQHVFRRIHPGLGGKNDKGLLNHEEFQHFVNTLIDELKHFNDFLRVNTKINTNDGQIEINQGGLITDAFSGLTRHTHDFFTDEDGRYFTNVDLFRGAMIDEDLDDIEICKFFLEPKASGVSYTALRNSGQKPTSFRKIAGRGIQSAIDKYNKLFANYYLSKFYPQIELDEEESIDRVIANHTNGGQKIWNSPFVSTTIDESVAINWARVFNSHYAYASKHGVVFQVKAPTEGVVLTMKSATGTDIEGLPPSGMQSEKEVLIAGGLLPDSIRRISVFDRDERRDIESVIATREENGDILIQDRRGEYIVNKRYAVNPNGQLVLVSYETTDDRTADLKPRVITYKEQNNAQALLDALSKEKNSSTKFITETTKKIEKENLNNFSKHLDIIKEITNKFDGKILNSFNKNNLITYNLLENNKFEEYNIIKKDQKKKIY